MHLLFFFNDATLAAVHQRRTAFVLLFFFFFFFFFSDRIPLSVLIVLTLIEIIKKKTNEWQRYCFFSLECFFFVKVRSKPNVFAFLLFVEADGRQ